VAPNTPLPGQANCSYQGFCGRWDSRQRGRGQFLQAYEAKALQERLRCHKAQPTVGTGKFLHDLKLLEEFAGADGIFNNSLNLRSEILAMKMYLFVIEAQYHRRVSNV
jgi:hypothetical protein